MTSNLEIASRWRRFVAFIIDAALLRYLTQFMGVYLVAYIEHKFDVQLDDGRLDQLVWVIWNILGLFYFPISTAIFGATLGKGFLGIRVVSNEGAKLSIGRIFLRETIGRWGGTLVLGHIWLLFNKRRKNAWDYLAESIVVRR